MDGGMQIGLVIFVLCTVWAVVEMQRIDKLIEKKKKGITLTSREQKILDNHLHYGRSSDDCEWLNSAKSTACGIGIAYVAKSIIKTMFHG